MPNLLLPPAIALLGPTASGKSALALEWAQRLGGEIVSIDSALIYRHLNIGAAKPNQQELEQVPHHMIDLRDPWQTYSAAEFAQDARLAIDGIVARGRVPILAGGTGLYFQALTQGLADMPQADPALRAIMAADAARRGWPALHAELAQVDPLAAGKIKPTDPQRIQRALEVFRVSGRPISQWQRDPVDPRLPVRMLKLVLAPAERAVLHQRIERRFDAMLSHGFLEEVRALRAMPQMQVAPVPLDLPAVRAVGYRQAWQWLDGQGSAAEFRASAIAATRQLAKRQLTWLRGRHDLRWFDPATQRIALEQALALFLGCSKRDPVAGQSALLV